MAGGRPTKYKDLDLDKVKKVALKGWTDAEMADFFEVHIATWYRWKVAHDEFCEALKEWKAEADLNVERSLYERATGYSHEETKFFAHEGKITDKIDIIKHYPPDTTAAIFWLKNRNPSDWKDKHDINNTGSLTVTIDGDDSGTL